MADIGYVNKEVRAMYGIPLSNLTPKQRKILKEDGERRAKLIDEREQAVLKNNLKAFEDEAKMEKVLSSIYKQCQKDILADVADTMAKVKRAGGEWSYANQSALTRSAGLFDQIAKELNKLGVKEEVIFKQGFSNLYTDQFLRQVYTLGKTMNVKADFNRLNPDLIKKTLDYPWSGAMFSDRLWVDKETLGRNLRAGLTQSMVLGESMDQISDRIRKNIDTSEYNSMRVARTETKRVTYVAHRDVYDDNSNGIKSLKYRTANGGDSRVCSICRGDEGKVFKQGEEPTLPRHPNCRCVYIPQTADTFDDNELNELTGSIRGAENYEKWRKAEEERLLKDKSLKLPDEKDNDIINLSNGIFTGDLGKEIRTAFDGGAIKGSMKWDDYKEERLKELYDQKKLLTDPKHKKQIDSIIKNHEEYKKLCNDPKGVILEMQSTGSYKLTIPPSQSVNDHIRNSEYYNKYKLVETSYDKYNYDVYEERLGGKYFISMKGVTKKEKEEVYKICDSVFKLNTRAVGAKVKVDTTECNKHNTRRTTNLGFYTPSQHKLTVRTFKSYNEIYRTTGDAGRDYFAGTIAHEFAHIVHSKDSRLSKVVANGTQWGSWKELVDPYYVQYRENKLIDFKKEWKRFDYPVNSQDHYSDRSKDHYYQEIWAEATAVLQEDVSTEKKADEVSKLKKYFPKVAEYVSAFYKGGGI